ncbi:MAG: hypothetical protein LBI38_04675 [Oscillospiraceae bacterium]|jgi:hypothetical protein|nr:hypothetical protein [Oscillospiraceae bacterium]
MKKTVKFLTLVLSILTAFALAACGGDNGSYDDGDERDDTRKTETSAASDIPEESGEEDRTSAASDIPEESGEGDRTSTAQKPSADQSMAFRYQRADGFGVLVELKPSNYEPGRTDFVIAYYQNGEIWLRFFENYGHVNVAYTDDISFSVTVDRVGMNPEHPGGARYDADGNVILGAPDGTLSMTVTGGQTLIYTDVRVASDGKTTTETYTLSRVVEGEAFVPETTASEPPAANQSDEMVFHFSEIREGELHGIFVWLNPSSEPGKTGVVISEYLDDPSYGEMFEYYNTEDVAYAPDMSFSVPRINMRDVMWDESGMGTLPTAEGVIYITVAGGQTLTYDHEGWGRTFTLSRITKEEEYALFAQR